ncbi:MAG TPA: methyltransferase domain-containing protein [Thermoanaerobaculia bacterium]|nr:methyltransferase domain-containing protein [Thermoanaerobaculia bacterium]
MATRMHVLGRFLTCPFLRVLDFLPPGALLLDLGAGHAIFAHLALVVGARRAVAVEPDLRKIFYAFPHSDLQAVCGLDGAIAGRFGTVALVDVLYRLPTSEWDALFRSIHERLEPGGVFLLKEMDPEHRAKARWNRLQEWLVDRVGLTLGEHHSFETREQIRGRLLRAGFASCEAVEIGAGYPHAHILYIGRV